MTPIFGLLGLLLLGLGAIAWLPILRDKINDWLREARRQLRHAKGDYRDE